MAYEYQFATDSTRRTVESAVVETGGGLPAMLQLLEMTLECIAVAADVSNSDTPDQAQERELFRSYARSLCQTFLDGKKWDDKGE